MRECGDCSLCCKIPFVAELNKAVDQWCQHCKPGKGGCTIYESRPEVCRTFQCEWIKGVVPDIWKPTTAKIILALSKASDKITFMNAMVDIGTPNRWREQPYHLLLRTMALVGQKHNCLVRVQVGNRGFIILPDRDIEIPEGTTSIDVQRVYGDLQLVFN